jgi:hypothetical protein
VVTQKFCYYEERLNKMNTQQIQFNRQNVISFLMAGLVVAVIATLIWTWTDTSGSTFLDCESQLSSELLLTTAQGGKVGGGMDRTGYVDCESGLPSWSQLRSTKAGKMGGISGGLD